MLLVLSAEKAKKSFSFHKGCDYVHLCALNMHHVHTPGLVWCGSVAGVVCVSLCVVNGATLHDQ